MHKRIVRAAKKYAHFAVITLFAVVGVVFYVNTRAATSAISIESEDGAVTAPAISISDTAASSGKGVQFKAQPAPPTPPTPPPASMNPVGPTGTWNLKFNDEFDGTAVNTAKWTDESSSQSHLMQGNAGNGQLEWNQMANCKVQNGLLTLQAKRETVNKSGVTYDWTSCLLTTSAYTFQNGYIGIRVKQPPCNSGMWPAFWTWQAPGANMQREIDVYEYWPSWSGRCAKFTAGTHGSGLGGSNQQLFDYDAGTTAQQYNIHGAETSAAGTTFYLNGKAIRTIANKSDGPMSIIVNLAVWKDIPPPANSNGAIKEVDYIRAWQR